MRVKDIGMLTLCKINEELVNILKLFIVKLSGIIIVVSILLLFESALILLQKSGHKVKPIFSTQQRAHSSKVGYFLAASR